jgi:hypothetical protein
MKHASPKHRRTNHSRLQAAAYETLEPRQMLCALHADESGFALNRETGEKNIVIDEGGDGPSQTRFNTSTRWGATASGPAASNGHGVTLTWSIVPDGTLLGSRSTNPEPNTGSNFIQTMNFKYVGGNWISHLEAFFAAWSNVSGINFVRVSDDGAAFPTSPGALGSRGDIRIGSHYIDGANKTLAYNKFPSAGGDMVIDSDDLLFGPMAAIPLNPLPLLNVFDHELGHGLGLEHVCPENKTKLMEPIFTTDFYGPQFDDILGIQRLYGDFDEKGQGNNTAATAVNLGTSPTLVRPKLSISNNSDFDYYKFNVTGAMQASIQVVPQGGTYLSGVQNGDVCTGGSPFNATAQNDLKLQIIAADGTTVLGNGDQFGVGFAEPININLSAGTYYARVSAGLGGTDLAQMYDLNMLTAPVAPQVTIQPVSPDPRINPVHSINIDFNQAVNGFELADLIFSRDGQYIPLTGATLTTTNNINFTLGNLDDLTDQVGVFSLRLIGAAGTNITSQNAGLLLSGDWTESWLMQGLNLTEANDYVRLFHIPQISMTYALFNEQTSAGYAFTTATPMDLVINGFSGDDIVVLDFSSGPMLPSNTVTVRGGANSDTLYIKGTEANDSYSSFFFGNSGSFNGSTITFDATEYMTLNTLGGNDAVSISNFDPSVSLWIDTANGDDDITLGNGNLNIFGAVTVQGNAGDDHLWINDLLGTPGSYRLDPGYVRRPASAAQPTVTYGQIERMQINAGGSSDAIMFAGAAPGQLVTLNGGGGNDVITIGDGNMNNFNLAGNTIVSGGPGTNSVVFDDSTAPGDAVYTLGPTTLGRTGMPPINFEFFQNVVLNAATGNNSIEFNGSGAVATTVNGGQGADSMVMYAAAGGPLLFNGGKVNSPEDLLAVFNGNSYTFNADANLGTTALHVWVNTGSSVQFNTSQHLKGLGISGSAALAAAAQPLVLSTTYLAGMFGGPFGQLDLANGYAIVNYDDTGFNPLDELRGYLASGYNGGAWNGPGINSSVAAVTPNRAIGIAHATHLGSPDKFIGEAIDSTTVLMSYTLYGDANLSRSVDVADLGILASNWQGTPRVWSQGNFNFDAVVNVADLGILASNWQSSIAAGASAPAGALPIPFNPPLRIATRLVEELIL